MKPFATLALTIAFLTVVMVATARQGSGVAAQDSPAAPAGTPAASEDDVEPTATAEPTTEPTATTAPSATAEPTVSPEPSPTPEPSPPSEPPASELPPPTETATATATATPDEAPAASFGAAEQPSLTLTVAGEAVSFGRVTATGELDPAIRGLSSDVDERGAFYVLAGAVVVTVEAGVPWTGTCRAEEQSGTAQTVTVTGGRLEWRLAGTEIWTPFAPDKPDPGCFPRPEIGTGRFVYDLRLRIEADDPPGTFRTVLLFEAVP